MRGELRAVITTDALELGIDIGSLDAALVVTFPGTVASLRQMWGRAGRRGHGLAMFVAGEDALDQFFCRHPDEFLGRPVEAALLDHESPQIHLAHLLCAAHEGPLSASDAEFLGPRWQAGAELLVSAGALRECKPTSTRRESYTLRRPSDYPAAGRLPSLGLPRQLRHHRRRLGRAVGHHRGGARPLHRASGRDLPASRSLLRGARARSRSAPRAGRPLRRRLVHPAQARDANRDRASARPAPGPRSNALVRTGQRHRHRPGLPTPAGERSRGDRSPDARSPARPPSPPRRCGTSWMPALCTRMSPSRLCWVPCTPPSTPRSPSCR